MCKFKVQELWEDQSEANAQFPNHFFVIDTQPGTVCV